MTLPGWDCDRAEPHYSCQRQAKDFLVLTAGEHVPYIDPAAPLTEAWPILFTAVARSFGARPDMAAWLITNKIWPKYRADHACIRSAQEIVAEIEAAVRA